MKGRAFRMRRSGPVEQTRLIQEVGRGTPSVAARVAGST
jgi:hypothetical protein